jgi:hypothetical protein
MAILGKLGNYRNFGLLIIRVGLGLMFIYHGLPKLAGGVETWRGLGYINQNVGIPFCRYFGALMAAATETYWRVCSLLAWHSARFAYCWLLIYSSRPVSFSQRRWLDGRRPCC